MLKRKDQPLVIQAFSRNNFAESCKACSGMQHLKWQAPEGRKRMLQMIWLVNREHVRTKALVRLVIKENLWFGKTFREHVRSFSTNQKKTSNLAKTFRLSEKKFKQHAWIYSIIQSCYERKDFVMFLHIVRIQASVLLVYQSSDGKIKLLKEYHMSEMLVLA